MDNIIENFDLSSITTFNIHAKSKYFAEVNNLEELKKVLEFSKSNNLTILPIGGGSNLLFTKNYDGIIIKINIKGISTSNNNENTVLVTAKSGEIWHDFVLFCIDKDYGGIENLSLIPGNVGAVPIQNIGAYGKEVKDVFVSLKALNIKSQEIDTFDNISCDFGYRNSFFKKEGKGKYIILEVSFLLTKKNHNTNTSYGAINSLLQEKNIEKPTIKDISNCVIEIRKTKLPDPQILGNAGSFFKNPTIPEKDFKKILINYPNAPHYKLPDNKVKIPAGWLIEQTGWKGKKSGNTGVSEKQALVLINYGGATGEEVYQLSENIIKSIKEKFSITLEQEVNII